MTRGKLIVIEGTDCSGKETQSTKLVERLNKEGKKTVYYSFPKYDTPSGRIVGLSYLGKPYLAEEMISKEAEKVYRGLQCNKPSIDRVLKILNAMHPDKFTDEEVEQINVIIEDFFKMFYQKKSDIKDQLLLSIILSEVIESLSHGWFPEGAPNVDPKAACLYYAADRRYNLPTINRLLEEGNNIVLDRYIYSNTGHQGGKIEDYNERQEMFKWIDTLEFGLLELPQSDVRIFLHMPTDYAALIKKEREEALDEHECDPRHLYNAERAYLEIAEKYQFDTIESIRDNASKNPKKEDIKTPDEISEEVYNKVIKELKLK